MTFHAGNYHFFVVICIGLGILKAIWDALSEVLLGLLGLGIIIAAVVFLGPLALGLLGAAIPVILALLPFGLALLAALLVLGCVLRFFQGLKYRGRVRTLKKLGIDKMNGSEEMWAGRRRWGKWRVPGTDMWFPWRFTKRWSASWTGCPS